MAWLGADLARLGNLLKLRIDEKALDLATATELLTEIHMRQGEVKAAVRDKP